MIWPIFLALMGFALLFLGMMRSNSLVATVGLALVAGALAIA